jgi:hypothetical protein
MWRLLATKVFYRALLIAEVSVAFAMARYGISRAGVA